jgi:hypothetical protein
MELRRALAPPMLLRRREEAVGAMERGEGGTLARGDGETWCIVKGAAFSRPIRGTMDIRPLGGRFTVLALAPGIDIVFELSVDMRRLFEFEELPVLLLDDGRPPPSVMRRPGGFRREPAFGFDMAKIGYKARSKGTTVLQVRRYYSRHFGWIMIYDDRK